MCRASAIPRMGAGISPPVCRYVIRQALCPSCPATVWRRTCRHRAVVRTPRRATFPARARMTRQNPMCLRSCSASSDPSAMKPCHGGKRRRPGFYGHRCASRTKTCLMRIGRRAVLSLRWSIQNTGAPTIILSAGGSRPGPCGNPAAAPRCWARIRRPCLARWRRASR